jgi:tetratricopeptide (TPR) repeat protein
VLVGEAYQLLDRPGQQVMQALSVYPAPVSAVGVDFVLRPVNPTIDAAPILARLVRRQLVRFQDGHYYLHPLDRDYARSQLPPGSSGDAPAAFTLTGLQTRAADYYAQIQTPRESWSSLEDVRPQLAEFELRCNTGDYDTAATVLSDIDFDYLQVWGHYRTLVDLHGRIHGRITDPELNATHLQNLGLCHYSMGDYHRAMDLFTQFLAIAREVGDRYNEANMLNYLGRAWLASGDARHAVTLLEQAIGIADTTGDSEPAVEARSGLAQAQLQLGDPAAALTATTARPELSLPTEEPMVRLLEGLALLELDRADEGVRAFSEALRAADALLALADRNVAALRTHALAVSGLAAATGDPTRATEAVEAFARADTVTSAAGVVADTHRLLEAIATYDRTGLLAEVRAAQDL